MKETRFLSNRYLLADTGCPATGSSFFEKEKIEVVLCRRAVYTVLYRSKKDNALFRCIA